MTAKNGISRHLHSLCLHMIFTALINTHAPGELYYYGNGNQNVRHHIVVCDALHSVFFGYVADMTQ